MKYYNIFPYLYNEPGSIPFDLCSLINFKKKHRMQKQNTNSNSTQKVKIFTSGLNTGSHSGFSKKIKFLIYLSIIGGAIIGNKVSAQTKSPEERARELTASMDCEVGLLPDQLPEIYNINLKAAKGMDEALQGHEENIKLYHHKGKAIDKERDIELRKALNDKQFSVYERISMNNQRMLKKTSSCREDPKEEYDSCSF